MIPKLDFVYSRIYDAAFHYYTKRDYKNSEARIQGHIRILRTKWAKIAYETLNLISRVSGLKWKRKEICCYVVRGLDWDFADPLTINMNNDVEGTIEVIIHELCHNIIFQNQQLVSRRQKTSRIWKKYRREHFVVKEHILSEAIQELVMKRLYGEDKTARIIDSYRTEGWKWHYRAFKIVEREGAENIIKELTS